MAIDVKPLDKAAEKYARNAQAASAEYGTQAAASGPKWQSATTAAAPNYGTAVRAAGIENRFKSGVGKAGAAKFSRKITEVGAGRYGEGVSKAQGDWQSDFAPYAQVIAGLSLAARRPRGDPANNARSAQVAAALHARRLALLGGASS